jgi:hypothetical protein
MGRDAWGGRPWVDFTKLKDMSVWPSRDLPVYRLELRSTSLVLYM